MKILIACKEFPHSKVIGGPILVFNRLKYLSKNHIVSLVAFAGKEDEQYIPSVRPFCHDIQLVPLPPKRSLLKRIRDFFLSPIPPYFLRMHGSTAMRKTIAEMVKKDKYDFVIGEYSVMGQFIHNNLLLPPVQRIVSVHECYYLARLKDYRHYAVGFKKLKEALNLKGLKKYEFDMYLQADRVLALTPQGRDELLDICPQLNISIVPHGVDTEHFSFSPLENEENAITFVGNYLHYPNVDAILFFHEEIWPLLKKIAADTKLYIVGQSPPDSVRAFSQDKDVIVTGRVDDVAPYLKKGKVFICPVRLGGGFRGKILEAMSAGRPVVSTSLGAEGIPADHQKNIIIADSPSSFAQGIAELLSDDLLYERIRMNARKMVEEKYAWEKGVEVLKKVLDEMMETRS